MKKILISLCLSTIICWAFPPTVLPYLEWTDHEAIPGGTYQKASIYTELKGNDKSQVHQFYGWPKHRIDIVLKTEEELTCEDPNVSEWTTKQYQSWHNFKGTRNKQAVSVEGMAIGKGDSLEFATQSLADFVWHIKPIRADAPLFNVEIIAWVKYELDVYADLKLMDWQSTWHVVSRIWMRKDTPTGSPSREAEIFGWNGGETEASNHGQGRMPDLEPAMPYHARLQSACRLWQSTQHPFCFWAERIPECGATTTVWIYLDPDQTIATDNGIYKITDLYTIEVSPDIVTPLPDPKGIGSILPLLLVD